MAKKTYRSAGGKKRAEEVRKKKAIILLIIVGIVVLVSAVFIFRLITPKRGEQVQSEEEDTQEEYSMEGAPPIDVQLLTPNPYSRPQIQLKKIKGIVIHYIANPESTAQANRDYFENLKDTHTTKASSHFLVGLEGEIIQCIPTTEVAYTSNDRNVDTLSIETCHPDETGEFTNVTYDSLVELTGWLCWRHNLKTSDVIRHYDVTGKICPKYFVENEGAWEQFLADVQADIDRRKLLNQGDSAE